MNEQERQTILASVLAGDLSAWNGLPTGATAADFAALAVGEIAVGVGRLAGAPVSYRDYAGFPGPLRVFFDDDGCAFLVWADWPPGGDGTATLAALGPPDVVLWNAPSRRPGTVQQVWGGRGVAAYVAGDGSARGLALFQPAAPDAYLANLGGDEGLPYRPYRSGV